MAGKARNAAEEEYLAKLQAIRRQNYLEKKRIQERVNLPSTASPGPPSPPPRAVPVFPRPHDELEARRKKIAALKVGTVESCSLVAFKRGSPD